MGKKKAVAEETPTDVLTLFVTDQSGSMYSYEQATIDGFNQILTEQAAVEGSKAYISLVTFDTDFDVRFVGVDAREVPHLGTKENPYCPNGGTALYDAVIAGIKGVSAWLTGHPSFTGQVKVVIQTDGGENSSRTATLDDVNRAIREKTKEGWEFVFMGAGQAAWTEGNNFSSIPVSNRYSVTADPVAMAAAYDSVSSGLTVTRSTGSMLNSTVAASAANFTAGGSTTVLSD